jgi:hypothetical protein
MKSQFTTMVLSAAVSVLLGTQVMSAQDEKEVAKIPFAFQASQRTLPAGEYTVAETGTRGLFRVYNATGDGLFVSTVLHDSAQPNHPKLTFLCDGSRRILATIQTDSGQNYGVSDSAIQKELSRQVHMSAVVSVALTHR